MSNKLLTHAEFLRALADGIAEASAEHDRLETQEFYEVCQQYRHALDVAASDEATASEAFEYLKGWVRGYTAAAVQQERERCAKLAAMHGRPMLAVDPHDAELIAAAIRKGA